MSEYIRRSLAEEAIEEYICRRCEEYNELEGGCISHAMHCSHLSGEEILKPVENENVQPVRHGRWIRTDKSMGVETVYACSECGYLVRESDRTNYCGDCGSKLDIVYQDDKVTATKVTGW